MFSRAFTFVVIGGIIVGALLYVNGYFAGNVDVELTKTGRAAINNGLDKGVETLNNVLERVKVDKAPQLGDAETATAK